VRIGDRLALQPTPRHVGSEGENALDHHPSLASVLEPADFSMPWPTAISLFA
jgi:hypothetical protein